MLGKKRTRKSTKSKALPEAFPNEGPARLDEAYNTLTKAAFAAWIRMSAESEALVGRGHVARVLGYSPRRSNEVLRELARKGFVSFITQTGKPTQVVIERRALISRRSNFARLS